LGAGRADRPLIRNTMKWNARVPFFLAWLVLLAGPVSLFGGVPGQTVVSIVGEDFWLNGHPTYPGRVWNGHRIEGLLLNTRTVQAVFDDLNPVTAKRWVYPDTGRWDAERNVNEFIAALPDWKRHGLLAVSVNFQGGSPEGYSSRQPWETGAFTPEGALRPEFADRLRRVLDAADAQGMVVILGYFYFGQSPRFTGEAAVVRATDEATRWLLAGGWRNVLVEVDNESNPKYLPPILRPDRVVELITRVRQTKAADGHGLLAGTSFGGRVVPTASVLAVSDFSIIHGNSAHDPIHITELIHQTRMIPTFHPMPVLINEDDHENFDRPTNNFTVALGEHVSWGWFDYRRKGEGFHEGFQSPPVDWSIGSERKRAFFNLCAEVAGVNPARAGLRDVYRNQFAIGTCYPNSGLTAAEGDFLAGNFSSVTAENLMKPVYLQPAEGHFTFAAADRMVAFAASHGLKIHGHTLVWYQQTPDWFFRDGTNPAGRELVLQRMTNHIATVVGHYRGRVASWDVVNEALDDHDAFLRPTPWLKAIGEDYLAEAFRAAHRADPSARLFYNDFDIESPPKREKALRLIRSLKAQGVTVDGIGIQGHWRLDRVPYEDLAAAITAFHAEGLRVAISELDLDVVPRAGNAAYVDYQEAGNGADLFANGCPAEVLDRQAEQYGRLFRLLTAQSGAIDRVTFWGLDDGRSWLNYWPRRRTDYPLLWTRDLQAKPALAAVVVAASAGAQ